MYLKILKLYEDRKDVLHFYEHKRVLVVYSSFKATYKAIIHDGCAAFLILFCLRLFNSVSCGLVFYFTGDTCIEIITILAIQILEAVMMCIIPFYS